MFLLLNLTRFGFRRNCSYYFLPRFAALGVFAIVTCATHFAYSQAVRAPSNASPNVIVIMTDDKQNSEGGFAE